MKPTSSIFFCLPWRVSARALSRGWLAAAWLLLPCCCFAEKPLLLKSPSGNLTVSLFRLPEGPAYQVALNGKTIVMPSPLGLQIDGAPLLNKKEVPALVHTALVTDTLRLLKDNYQARITKYKKYTIAIGSAQMEFALFNDGCAFRYKLPENGGRVQAEQTAFTLNENEPAWFFERTNNWKLKSYAGEWMQTRLDSLDRISPGGPVQGKPVVVEWAGGYLFVMEAALSGFSGMRLKAAGNRLSVDFTEGAAGFVLKGKAAAYTPWRVIGFAKDLNALVNHSMIASLNPTPDPVLFQDREYIKPGRAVWSWITRDAQYLDPGYEKQLIRAAAELGFEYTMIDDGWEDKWADKWSVLKELVGFGMKKQVGIWVWKDSKYLRDSSYRNAFLDTLHQLGVAGIKIDFMNSEAKELIDFETGFLEAAARRKLMVNFHGCQTSTGEYRTYPNEMTREGIRGMELNIMNEPIPAAHNAALPFTRLITGPADYTPGLFSQKGPVTYTHQLALLYLMESPFQCVAENPLTLLKDPVFKPVLSLLRTLPVTWDERVVLPGSRIGRCAIIAKRKGRNWYIAAINGGQQESAQQLDLSFIPDLSAYKATLIRDGGGGFIRSAARPEQLNKMKITLPPAGGMVLCLEAEPEGTKKINK